MAVCISDEVATGTPTAAASSCWNSARKPQFVVMPSTPSRLELARGVDEGVEKPLGPLPHDTLRRGVADHLVVHGKGPCRGVAHVARNPREAGLQHEYADRGAVDRLSTACFHFRVDLRQEPVLSALNW